MTELTKEDVLYSIKRVEQYIVQMPNEEFLSFCEGIPIFSVMIAPNFHLYDYEESLKRNLVKLEFRIS